MIALTAGTSLLLLHLHEHPDNHPAALVRIDVTGTFPTRFSYSLIPEHHGDIHLYHDSTLIHHLHHLLSLLSVYSANYLQHNSAMSVHSMFAHDARPYILVYTRLPTRTLPMVVIHAPCATRLVLLTSVTDVDNIHVTYIDNI